MRSLPANRMKALALRASGGAHGPSRVRAVKTRSRTASLSSVESQGMAQRTLALRARSCGCTELLQACARSFLTGATRQARVVVITAQGAMSEPAVALRGASRGALQGALQASTQTPRGRCRASVPFPDRTSPGTHGLTLNDLRFLSYGLAALLRRVTWDPASPASAGAEAA